MRKWLLLIMLVSLPVAAVTMYRWVDEAGLVHYSDKPRPGAVEIEVDSVQGFAPEPLYRSERSVISRNTEDTSGYESFTITAPGQDEVMWNIGGVVNVVVDISPPLRGGDTIAVFFDGQNVSAPGSRRRSYVLNDVFRGTHTVRAVVHDRNGNEIEQSEIIAFQVHQTSVN